MIEKLTKLEEAPTDGDRRKYKSLIHFIKVMSKKAGVDFYPCRHGGKKGDMCATIAAKSKDATLCMASFPSSHTIFSVRRDDVPTRQLMAESNVSDALAVTDMLEKVYDSLNDIAARLGNELTVEACGLTWRLAPVLPRQEEEDESGGMPNMGGKSNVDPAMETRIKKALAEQLAKEGKQPTGAAEETADPQPEPSAPQIEHGHKDEVAEFANRVATDSEPVCLDSGLAYIDIEEGEGDPPSPESTVRVHYTGRLADGTEFDSSRGEPMEFRLDGVIAGWTEGVGSMRPGGKRRLIIPSELGYGSQGFPPKIPPDAMLDFDVELLEVKGNK